ncbi:DinB family protein [Cellulomonas sp. S1-8]|uniref:DinB family protein n=1 Tax=Cellulomonas sp. S1-8 TaxID=2904790 RepID=UPI002244DB37|nr:DinB family protein [Cellulomonas sp. S1-8]UZN03220.1 DinB family protein [Cellulomonas sp. S1-8]
MTETTPPGPPALDTSIHEPALDAGEVDLLLFMLERTRATFAWKVGGLDAEALRRPFPPSQMTLGGLVKHLAFVEEDMVVRWLGVGGYGAPWNATTPDDWPGWDWRSATDDSPADLYGWWQAAVERSRAVWASLTADGGLDEPAGIEWPDGQPNRRRVLVDLNAEYARHLGHADLFREAIDGLVGEDPPQP